MRYLELKFLDKSVILYPLNLEIMQDHPEEVRALFEGTPKGEAPFGQERMAKLLRLFHASAQRGDAAVTLKQVSELVDASNILACTKAILGQDWDAVDDPPDVSAKETAAPPTSPLTGGASTPG